MYKTPGLFILFIITTGMVIWSCKPEGSPDEEREKSDLQNYYNTLVNQYGADAIKPLKYGDIEDEGYFVSLSTGNTGIKPLEQDYVIIDFLGTYLDGRVYETTLPEYKDQWDVYKNYPYDHYSFNPLKLSLYKKAPGLIAGLLQMDEGDSALFVMPSALFLNDIKFTPLVYYVKLHKVIKDIVDYDSIQVDFFKHEFDSLATGVYFKKNIVTTQQKAEDSAYINFTGYYMQENNLIPFESTNGEFKKIFVNSLSSAEGFVSFPKGFSSIFDTLHFGEKTEVIIEYPQAYNQGLKHSIFSYMIVPPYTSLYYTVEMDSVP